MQYAFDAGHLFVTPKGSASPVRIGSLQEVKLDIDRRLITEALGFQTAVKAAFNKTTIKGKAKTAQINGALFSEIFFGQASLNGAIQAHDSCPFTVPGNPGPYQVTVPSFVAVDLGVNYADNNTPPLTLVLGAPGPGQYQRAGQVYTFNAADAGKNVLISFAFPAAGKTLSLINEYWLEAPQFRLTLFQAYGGKQVVYDFPNCVSEHLGIQTVLENFTIPEFSFEVLSSLLEPKGLVGTISTTE